MTNKRFELLNSLPPYGPMYLSVSENGHPFYSEGVVVRFHQLDGTKWIANFQPGSTEFKAVMELGDTHKLVVIAYGICYIMNPDETRPLAVFGDDYCGIFKASNNRIVLHNQTELSIIEADGNYWKSDGISWDGLQVIKVDNNLVSGFSHDPDDDNEGWVAFSYDIDTKTLFWRSHFE